MPVNYLTFNDTEELYYDTAILHAGLDYKSITKEYLPNLDSPNVISFDLLKQKKKTSVKIQKEYFEELDYYLKLKNVKYLIVADAEYFKTIAKVTKVINVQNYVLDSFCGSYKVIYCPSYKTVFYDPEKVREKIAQALASFNDYVTSNYVIPGSNIIHTYQVLDSIHSIKGELQHFIDFDIPLAIDIETFDLKHYNAGIASITFCLDEHNGFVIPVDITPYNTRVDNKEVKEVLKNFFMNYKGKAIYHNISFDVTVLIYVLFMDYLSDTAGLLQGLEVMLNNFDDTMIIAFLAINSTAEYSLSLKQLSHEYSGNYSVEDINDVLKIPYNELLKYNLIDGLSTWFVKEKYEPIMIKDNQLDVYNNIFKPAVKDIIQMQLTGLPIDLNQVSIVKKNLTKKYNEHLNNIINLDTVKQYENDMIQQWVIEKNSILKKKVVTADDCKYKFNLNSGNDLVNILYDSKYFNLPVLELTKTGNPGTGKKVIEVLTKHTSSPEAIKFIENTIAYKDIDKMLTSFIPAFEKAQYDEKTDCHYLFGSFIIGGTISGRLSSRKPNLQNLPSSGSIYAKALKECFISTEDWVIVGVDYDSLESKIGALLTRDPARLTIFINDIDSHSYNALGYWPDKMNDIVEQLAQIHPSDGKAVAKVYNSIKKLYPSYRQDSKTPTFAMQYLATWRAIHKKCGFSEEESKSIIANYNKLYSHSNNWADEQALFAENNGYVKCAFGLRLRTPLLSQVILNTRSTPYQATKEKRSAINATQQSYGMLNNRACSAFMDKVRSSKYRYDIKPVCHIHDAQYYLVKPKLDVLHYVNENLIKEIQWQDDDNIRHDEVNMSGELSLFYPNWDKDSELVVPNNIEPQDMRTLINTFINKE